MYIKMPRYMYDTVSVVTEDSHRPAANLFKDLFYPFKDLLTVYTTFPWQVTCPES